MEPDAGGRHEYRLDAKHDKLYDTLTNHLHGPLLTRALREYSKSIRQVKLWTMVVHSAHIERLYKPVDANGNGLPLNERSAAVEWHVALFTTLQVFQ